MTIFYIVRHGETDWNKEQRLQGHLDSPLTKKGEQQAALLAKALTNVEFDAVISSSSERAVATARVLLSNRSQHIEVDDRLREIYLGQWQGRLISEIIASPDREDYLVYRDAPVSYTCKHTESFEQVTNRAMTILQETVERFPNGKVLIVSHGVTIKCIVQHILRGDFNKLWLHTELGGTSVTELEVIHGEWRLNKIGCTEHLQAGGTSCQ